MRKRILFCLLPFFLTSCHENGKSTVESEADKRLRAQMLLECDSCIRNDTLRGRVIEISKEGMRKYPDSHMFPTAAGFAYALMGNDSMADVYFEKALHVCDSMLAESPTTYDSCEKVLILVMLDRREEAESLYNEAPCILDLVRGAPFDSIMRREKWLDCFKTNEHRH